MDLVNQQKEVTALADEQPDNIVLEHLRHIRGKVDALTEDMIEVKERLGNIEAQYANLSERTDRIDGRTERIERRLEVSKPVS